MSPELLVRDTRRRSLPPTPPRSCTGTRNVTRDRPERCVRTGGDGTPAVGGRGRQGWMNPTAAPSAMTIAGHEGSQGHPSTS